MKLSVKNYRGIEAAAIEIDPVALVAGNNGAGKSSIAQAMTAALVRSPVPLMGLQKKDARDLLRDGQTRGKVELDGVSVSWPGGTVTGNGPHATATACGMVTAFDMKPADAARYLSETLGANPTEADLAEALPGATEATRAAIWKEIQASGWDGAHKRAKEAGSRLKGQWQQITGEAYGSKKAEDWAPAAFADGVPERQAVEQELKDAEAEHIEAVQAQALSADQLARLDSDIDAGEQAEKDLPDAEKTLSDAEKALDQARKTLDELPQPGAVERIQACPCCGEDLVTDSRGAIMKPSPGPTEKENAKRQNAIAKAREEEVAARHRVSESSQKVQRLKGWIALGEDSRAKKSSGPEEGTTEEELQGFVDAIEHAEYKLMMLNALDAANKNQRQILQNVDIVAALAPDGVRQTVTGRALEDFNQVLDDMAKLSGWRRLVIGDDLGIRYGDRDYRLLSASEQFRARTLLQIAIAGRDGSEALVIDAADILDKSGRNGLFKILRQEPLPALVCMTINSAADVPDLAKAGVGRSYWVEGATAEALNG